MFFEAIQLTDFRSHPETLLELERINIIRGPNAAGKSSIGQAFGYLLAARSEDTGENGQGAERMIRTGHKKAVLMAKLRSGALGRVTLNLKSGRDFQVKNGEWPRFSRDVLSCLCSTRYFLRLGEKRQQEILGGMVIPPDAPLPEDVIRLAVDCELAPHDELAAFDWLDTVYRGAFEARRDAKRDLKALVPVTEPDTDVPLVEEVRTRLYERRNEREEKVIWRARLVGAREAWKNSSSALNGRRNVLQARRDAQARMAETHQASVLTDANLAKHKKTMGREAEHVRLTNEYNTTSAELTYIAARKEALLSLDGETACPTCQQTITDEQLTAMVKPVQEEEGRLLARRSDTAKAIGDIPSIEQAKSAIARDAQAQAELKQVNQRIEQIDGDIRQIDTELRELGAEPAAADTAAIDAEIANLDERLKEGEKMERAALRAEADGKAFTEYTARSAELEKRVADLERLVTVTAPTGVRAELAEQYMQGFWGLMAETMSAFGYEISSRASQWFVNGLELFQLSQSEQLRFGAAFQIALAVTTGAGFVVIDEFDAFDGFTRNVLMTALMNEERIEQAIVIGTNESTDVPAAPGVAFFYFERDEQGNSETKVLTPEEATA